MQFTKPKSIVEVKPINVGVVIVGDTVVVSPCEPHSRTDVIKAALRADGWIVRPYDNRYTVDGFTSADRKVLRDELIKAYQGTLNEPDDTAIVNAIVKAIVIAECKKNRSGTPLFGDHFDAVKSATYDGSLFWKIDAARAIIELF